MDAQQFEDPRIESGLGWLVVGSSGSGKTQFVKNLLLNQEKIFKKPFTCIYYITAFYQDHFKELEDKLNVRFFTSWDHDELRSPESCLGGCWIIDDMAPNLSQYTIDDESENLRNSWAVERTAIQGLLYKAGYTSVEN